MKIQNKNKLIKYSKKSLSNLLIYPDKHSNKYSRGTCIVVAGSNIYPGAALLCSKAAQKSGAGYTKLYTSKKNKKIACLYSPSIPANNFKLLKKDNLISKNNKPKAIVVGPGFVPNSKKSINLTKYILSHTDVSVVIDGGALSALRNDDIRLMLIKRSQNNLSTIITPHVGEAKRILSYYEKDANKVFSKYKKYDISNMISKFTSSIVVLKDSDTYISYLDKTYIMNTGTAALAKAGSGDVLAGIIGGLLCQNKISEFDTCVLGTNIHALAGNVASKYYNSIPVAPEDVIDCISNAIFMLQKI